MKIQIICPTCKETYWITVVEICGGGGVILSDSDEEWDYVCEHIKQTGNYEHTDTEPSYDEF